MRYNYAQKSPAFFLLFLVNKVAIKVLRKF